VWSAIRISTICMAFTISCLHQHDLHICHYSEPDEGDARVYGSKTNWIYTGWTPRLHPLTEWTIPGFAFPAEAGTHLPIPEGQKAELALGGRLVTYRNKCLASGIAPRHDRPSSNRGEGPFVWGSVLGDVNWGHLFGGGISQTFEHITARPLLSS